MAQGIAEVLGEQAGAPEANPFAGTAPLDAKYAPIAFSGKRFVLEKLVQRAGSVVPTKEFAPLLSCFLADLTDTGLRLTATDMVLTIMASTTAVSASLPEGISLARVALPAKRLQAILKEAPDGDVTISVDGDTATVTAGTASWKLHLLDDQDFPPTEDITSAQLHETPREPLLAALKAVRYAVSQTKPTMAQVSIAKDSASNVMCVTGCDGTRFARVRLAAFPLAMSIPASTTPGAVDEVIKLLGSVDVEMVKVGVTDSRLVFQAGSVTLTANKLNLAYPNVDALLLQPALENKDQLVVDLRELSEALRRVRINADPNTSAIGIVLSDGKFTLVSKDTMRNTAEEAIPATWTGGDRKLVVNHKFLSEMLAAHPAASCVFRLGKDTGKKRSPVLLHDLDSGSTGVINQMSATLMGY